MPTCSQGEWQAQVDHGIATAQPSRDDGTVLHITMYCRDCVVPRIVVWTLCQPRCLCDM